MKTSIKGSKSLKASFPEETETGKGLFSDDYIHDEADTSKSEREFYDQHIEYDEEDTPENDWFDAENYNSESRA
jgi:hypothetical protein